MKSFLLMMVVIASAVAEGQVANPLSAKAYVFQGAQFQGSGQSLPVLGGQMALTTAQVDLSIQFSQACPPNRPCLDVVPAPYLARLPVVNVVPSLCGDRIIAQSDRTATEGVAERIEIVDYTRAVCEIMLPSIAQGVYTRVTLDRRTGRQVVHSYHFHLNPAQAQPFVRR